MNKFEFSTSKSSTVAPTLFTGEQFYNMYKDADFLNNSENIETILSKGHELRHNLKKIAPGQTVVVKGMMVSNLVPLMVKSTGPNVVVAANEFTYNRLAALTAAYTFKNRQKFPKIVSSEADLLGLVWENSCDIKCRLYLSAVTGTEHFYNQFSFWPLICALRKLQLGKIPLEVATKCAKVKNPAGVTLAKDLMQNFFMANLVWKLFPGESENNLDALLLTIAPKPLQNLFLL